MPTINPSFERRFIILLLSASLPSSIGLVLLMIVTQQSVYLTAIVALILVFVIGYCTITLVNSSNYAFRTLSNLLEAMTHGDYSLRGRSQTTNQQSALAELMNQINLLSDTLAKQKREVIEQQLLLNKVINQIDVAIIAIADDSNNNVISLANPVAAQLFNRDVASFVQSSAQDFNLTELIELATQPSVYYQFPNRSGQFAIAVDQFIANNQRQQLLFITDVKALLRSEERKTWQNLVRVLSHEINNSLTPIASISQTLTKLSQRSLSSPEQQELKYDLDDGLGIIQQRANSLKQFIDSYRQLSRLPEPQLKPVEFNALLNQVISYYPSQRFEIHCEAQLVVDVDAIQIEQLLINLIKNAVEAMVHTKGSITILCQQKVDKRLELCIRDCGPGLTNAENLFVPFYTTKVNGSGIGLVLCRQIVEAHQGDLQLHNYYDAHQQVLGCEVKILL